MAEAGNKARGAAAGSKTQARRVALQQEKEKRSRPWVEVTERRHDAPQLNETVLAEVQQHEARCKAGLVALGLLTDREKEESRHGPMNRLGGEMERMAMVPPEALDDPRRGLGPAGGVELRDAKADMEAHERRRQEHQFDLPPDLTGWAAPNVPEKGVWAELENLRHQVLKAHQSAEALAERLGGVLVPELAATRVAGPTPPSRLSEEVHLVAVSVVQVQDVLEGLLDRLDL